MRLFVGLVAVVFVGGAAVMWRSPALVSPPSGVPFNVGESKNRGRADLEAVTISAGGSAGITREAIAASGAAPRSVTVALKGVGWSHAQPVHVDLLFDHAGRVQRQVFRMRPGGEAEWRPGDATTWPFAVDFAFPTTGRRAVKVTDGGRYELALPPTCVMEFVVKDADGLPTGEELTASVRVPSSSAPGNRWHSVIFKDGQAKILAEASGQRVAFSVSTENGRGASGTFTAAAEPGTIVRCELDLRGGEAYPLRLGGLPQGPTPWRVDVHWHDGLEMVRAPKRGDEWLVFLRPDHIGSNLPGWPLDKGAFALATRAGECWWGCLRQRAAEMRPFDEVARGRVVDLQGRGVAGVSIALIPARLMALAPSESDVSHDVKAFDRRVSRARTGPDGSFVVEGPDPLEVDLVLVVEATGQRIQLPCSGPLRLAAPR